jgi:hypothetical protein
MGFKAYTDNTLGLLGKVVVLDPEHKEDREVIFKHPFLLRIRACLAVWRLVRRQRKLAKFNANHA